MLWVLALKEQLRPVFSTDRLIDGNGSWFASNLLAGGVAGVGAVSVMYPVDHARHLLADDNRTARKWVNRDKPRLDNEPLTYKYQQPPSITNVWRTTVAEEGMRGLWKGFGIAAAGIAVYRGAQFGLYDSLKPILFNGRWTKVASSSWSLVHFIFISSSSSPSSAFPLLIGFVRSVVLPRLVSDCVCRRDILPDRYSSATAAHDFLLRTKIQRRIPLC